MLSLTGRALGGWVEAQDLVDKVLEEGLMYNPSVGFPFMNNNACQIYFILRQIYILAQIDIINIQ